MAFIKMTIVLLFSAASVNAQTFAEWFSQGKTQTKYLLAQIEALQVYGGYLKKGYAVAKGGLGSISNYARNEFKLHTAYYDRLKTADPALKNNAQVKEIIAWQQDIIKQTNSWQADDQTYINKVKSALLKDCEALLNELTAKTEMSDEERLQQIEAIYAAMGSNLHFATGFSGQLKIYELQKQQEINNANTLIELYENR